MATLPPDLAEIRGQIEAADRRADDRTRGLTDAQFHWQPDGGRAWSVAQCLDHLATANQVYFRAMKPAVDAARARALTGSRPIASTIFGRWFISSMEPPVKRRLKAPGKILPVSTGTRQDIVRAYHDAHADLLRLIDTSADLDVNRATFSNPFISWVKVRVGTGLRIMCAHDRRHLWQLEQVLKAPGFPR